MSEVCGIFLGIAIAVAITPSVVMKINAAMILVEGIYWELIYLVRFLLKLAIDAMQTYVVMNFSSTFKLIYGLFRLSLHFILYFWFDVNFLCDGDTRNCDLLHSDNLVEYFEECSIHDEAFEAYMRIFAFALVIFLVAVAIEALSLAFTSLYNYTSKQGSQSTTEQKRLWREAVSSCVHEARS
jgi:hypothetical protein